jgi:hypothetical protein
MGGETLETLIAEKKRSYGLSARLGTRLANIRATWAPTRMFSWGRRGGAGLHVWRIAEAVSNPKR